MYEFGTIEDLSALVIHNRDPCGAATGIDLEAERPNPWLLYGSLEDQGKRIVLQYSGFPCFEQQTGTSWMYRVQGLFVGIDDKDETHCIAPLYALTSLPFDRGKVCLDNVHKRFNV
jgi:hypothetical protein